MLPHKNHANKNLQRLSFSFLKDKIFNKLLCMCELDVELFFYT